MKTLFRYSSDDRRASHSSPAAGPGKSGPGKNMPTVAKSGRVADKSMLRCETCGQPAHGTFWAAYHAEPTNCVVGLKLCWRLKFKRNLVKRPAVMKVLASSPSLGEPAKFTKPRVICAPMLFSPPPIHSSLRVACKLVVIESMK